ncbi:MAG: peroxiredoxin family protein [bacterium]|nr:peroxiredoxin family protein [bacterium]
MRRFEALKSGLGKHGVSVVALSKDSIEDAAHQKERDKLSFPLLSDPELDVINQYGVEHHKALEFSTGSFTLFGIPLALVPSIKKMAIPTTLLVDEEGVIQWIDQTDDYRLRSNEERVMEAVAHAFG